MGRDLRIVNMTEGQKAESDKVFKRMGEISYRDLGTLSKIGLFDMGKAVVTSGLRVASGGGMVVTVPTGAMLQRLPSGDILPIISTVDQTITLTAATGVPRIDTIECQVKSVIDKNDVAQSVLDPTTGIISLESIKRDVKYYLSVQAKTGSTAVTSATAGVLTGSVGIAGTIDLSATYLLNIADGEDGSFIEIDLRGATPEATTRAEIIANLNAGVGRVIASTGAGDTVTLTGYGTSETSYFEIKPPVSNSDADALQTVFGVSSSGAYDYIYKGTNDWIKLAEIDVGAATTVITAGLIRNVDQKSTWASDASNIITTYPALQPLSQRTARTAVLDTDLFPIESLIGQSLYSSWSLLRNSAYPDKKSYTNVLVKRNAGAGNTKIDIAFDEFWVQGIKLSSKSYTVDQTASGALGVDTGSVAQSLWYYFYILTNDTGTLDTAIMSINSTLPTLPYGYTKYRLISMAYTAVSTKYFVDFVQQDSDYVHGEKAIATGLVQTSYTEIDATVFIPEKVSEISLRIYADTSASASVTIQGYINGSYYDQAYMYVYSSQINSIPLILITYNRKLKYKNTAQVNNSAVYIYRFKVNL